MSLVVSSDSYTDGYNTGFKQGMNRGQRDCADKGSDGAYANPNSPVNNSNSGVISSDNNQPIINNLDLVVVGVAGGIILADIIINSIKENKARKLEREALKLEEIEYSENEIKEATKLIELAPNDKNNYYNRAIHKEIVGIYSFDDFDMACKLGHEKSCSKRNIGEFI